MGQVVDTETAQEFMRETLEKVEPAELEAICAEVEKKSAWFRRRLTADALAGMNADDLTKVFRCIFSVKRQVPKLLDEHSFEGLRDWTVDLLHGSGTAAERFERGVTSLRGVDEHVRRDVVSELLHFHDPESCWLWTRWMWDPKAKTGALPLVTTAAYQFDGDSPAEVYLRVGEAIAFVHEVGTAAGFQTISKNPFGTDVFLSCVYVVYAYTVLRMRMTQEFNKVMPGLPEFSRRLLGVYRKPKPSPESTEHN